MCSTFANQIAMLQKTLNMLKLTLNVNELNYRKLNNLHYGNSKKMFAVYS